MNTSNTLKPRQSEGVNVFAAPSQSASVLCDFCNLRIHCDPNQEHYTVDDALDIHYIDACKMLTSCEACNKIVEVSKLTRHLLDECEHRDKYTECPITGDAIDSQNQIEHDQVNVSRASTELLRCPLCHKYVIGKNGLLKDWQKHLVIDGCSADSQA